jgi:hypothetical protein
MNYRRSFLFSMFLAVVMALSTSAFADGWIFTGNSVRTKSIGPFTAKVYSIRHDMKERPPTKSKQAVIDANVDKRFTWSMLRDVGSGKIQNALREAFQMNGYNDGGKIGQFVGAFSGEEVKEESNGQPSVVITYTAANQTTTIWVKGGKTVSIQGQDFMKGVWSIWFGKIDQPSMGDQLISKL